ncbi:MAG: molybdopterin molybdenumtransferase MoeA, partial [Pseudomonadales bacterium]
MQALDLNVALTRMLGAISPTTGSETIAVADALHRVLAEDVRAPISLPPFPASAMDGYALRATDAGDA